MPSLIMGLLLLLSIFGSCEWSHLFSLPPKFEAILVLLDVRRVLKPLFPSANYSDLVDDLVSILPRWNIFHHGLGGIRHFDRVFGLCFV